jgi:hypothetical protein
MQNRHSLTTLWTTGRAELRSRRAERASDRVLRRELAAYRTPAELVELHEILARHSEEEVADLRRHLVRL